MWTGCCYTCAIAAAGAVAGGGTAVEAAVDTAAVVEIAPAHTAVAAIKTGDARASASEPSGCSFEASFDLVLAADLDLVTTIYSANCACSVGLDARSGMTGVVGMTMLVRGVGRTIERAREGWVNRGWSDGEEVGPIVVVVVVVAGIEYEAVLVVDTAAAVVAVEIVEADTARRFHAHTVPHLLPPHPLLPPPLSSSHTSLHTSSSPHRSHSHS